MRFCVNCGVFVDSSALRSTVTGFVYRSAAVGLWQRNAVWHSIPSHQADADGVEFCYYYAATRLVFSASRYDRITPLLTQLHWLKVPERIKSKLAVLVYKFLHQTAPPYLAEELHQSPADEARQRLRSASTSSLVVPRTRLSIIGDRAFPVAAARLWNTAAERHVGIVNICFQETFEDPSLQSFFF